VARADRDGERVDSRALDDMTLVKPSSIALMQVSGELPWS
jgi:hypothetical protein